MIELKDIHEAMTKENKIKVLNGALEHMMLAKEKNEGLGLCWSIVFCAYDVYDIQSKCDFMTFYSLVDKKFYHIVPEVIDVAKKHNADISDTWWWHRNDTDVRIKVLKETIKLLEQ